MECQWVYHAVVQDTDAGGERPGAGDGYEEGGEEVVGREWGWEWYGAAVVWQGFMSWLGVHVI